MIILSCFIVANKMFTVDNVIITITTNVLVYFALYIDFGSNHLYYIVLCIRIQQTMTSVLQLMN